MNVKEKIELSKQEPTITLHDAAKALDSFNANYIQFVL
jgi:hypothetical protein